MNREELFTSIAAARPGRDDIVYLERRGSAYDWRMVPVGDVAVDTTPSAQPGPDVWMSFSAAWPVDDADALRAFFDDMIAELESMADRADRCRWPIDEPWPHSH
jgi:hypothetical protein